MMYWPTLIPVEVSMLVLGIGRSRTTLQTGNVRHDSSSSRVSSRIALHGADRWRP